MNKLELTNINGNKIVIDLSDEKVKQHFDDPSNYGVHILNQINEGGCDVMKRFIPEQATCLDIGANVGLVSLWVAEKCKSVYSLEPSKTHFDILTKLTSPYKNISSLQFVLSNESKSTKFFHHTPNSTMNSLINFSGGEDNHEFVIGYRLDDFIFQMGNFDFCKIDIEGSEVIALNEEILSNCKGKIKAYYLETHNSHEINGRDQFGNFDIFTNMFKNLGYNVERVTHMVDTMTMICY